METTVFKNLEADLTDGEIAVYGKAMARLEQEYLNVADEKKVSSKQFKAQMDDLKKRIVRLAVSVNAKKVTKLVECKAVGDLDKNEVRYYRADTGALIDTRTMKLFERDGQTIQDTDDTLPEADPILQEIEAEE